MWRIIIKNCIFILKYNKLTRIFFCVLIPNNFSCYEVSSFSFFLCFWEIFLYYISKYFSSPDITLKFHLRLCFYHLQASNVCQVLNMLTYYPISFYISFFFTFLSLYFCFYLINILYKFFYSKNNFIIVSSISYLCFFQDWVLLVLLLLLSLIVSFFPLLVFNFHFCPTLP